MQGTTDQDKNHVWNESILENACEASFCYAINRTLRSSPQSNKISDNSKGTRIPEEMERANQTSLTPSSIRQHAHALRKFTLNYVAS